MKYKEIRTLTAYKPHLTTEDIIEIAEDIVAHSAPIDLQGCYDIGSIAWEVNRACNVSFMEQ